MDKNRRRIFWIDPKGQGVYILRIVMLEFVVAGITGLLTAFATLFFLERGLVTSPNSYWVQMYGYLLFLCLLLAIILVWVGVRLSHRIYGPIYRFKKLFQESIENQDIPNSVVLRKNDEFKPLAETINAYFDQVKAAVNNRQEAADAADRILQDLRNEVSALEGERKAKADRLLDQLESELSAIRQ